ncbi:Exo-polygalacturonase, family GH28 [Zostera marina]|uniref:Exopolygalacturonase n=1 Tax=Zostera marina TaxID=29655 RepID=A0A0K9PY88_ZOSMR|nr:Exo-polygalacturonase, family GH28 [Zostera marina]
MAKSFLSFLLFSILVVFYLPLSKAEYNIMSFGAKSNGHTDSTKAFLKASSSACSSSNEATIYVPSGKFLVGHVQFKGPCKSRVLIKMKGTLLAPSDYKGSGNEWIVFKNIDGLAIQGGTVDGRGQALWKCKESGKNCPHGWRSMLFDHSKNIKIEDLTSVNSKQFHIVIHSTQRVMLRKVTIIAPDESPNTDGISIQKSSDVTVLDANIKTGDDCISMSGGTRNVWAERISCGPGHGIGIGSIGKSYNEKGVQNITVKDTVFTGSDNGLRIKAWGRPTTTYVRGVVFENSIMKNVKNPIIINQNYCPHSKNCPNKHSGVTISDISYNNIQGSSKSSVAVKFDCSPANPCKGISLKNIKLTYHGGLAKSSCKYARGKSYGNVNPKSCPT